MKKMGLDPKDLGTRSGRDTSYPGPFKSEVAERTQTTLGDAFGLTNFGVNLTELAPGAWSAQRHWHSHEDEFVYIVSGELTLVSDAGEELLAAGMVAGFPAGKSDGHHLVNRSALPATYLEIGDRRAQDECHYPDIDLLLSGGSFKHKDGTPY